VNDPVVILKTGSTYPEIFEKHGDFEDWMKAGLNLPLEMTEVLDAQDLVLSPDNHGAAAVVVTGAVEMVTDHAPWSEAAAEWLAGLSEDGVPILGVCYGHQLLAHALGGEVGYHPAGREIGTVTIHKLPAAEDDPLLADLPESFPAQATHAQSVLTLPEGAVRLASSDVDLNAAFRIGERTWGVQFHPEFSADVMRMYVDIQQGVIREQGQQPEQIREAVRSSPAGRILERFGRLAT
jgi:GMP synthase (glutamine-hydrolysing)